MADHHKTEVEARLAARRVSTIIQIDELTRSLDDIIDAATDLVDVLRAADPDHKHEVYRSLGLQLTYQPDTRTVQARIDLGPHRWVFARVGGGSRPPICRTRAQGAGSCEDRTALRADHS